jgi:hypothetical protein
MTSFGRGKGDRGTWVLRRAKRMCCAIRRGNPGSDKATRTSQENHRTWDYPGTVLVSTRFNSHAETASSEIEDQGNL